MAWTKSERVMAALSGERPDRTPIFDYLIHDGVFERYLGRPVIPGEQKAILQATAECLDLCHPMPAAYEPHEETLPDGTYRRFERWMTWTVYPERSGGEMVKSLKDDIENLKSTNHWLNPDDTASWKEDAEQKHAWAGDMVYINLGLWVPFLPGRNIEEESFYLTDYPDMCGEWNKLTTEAVLHMVQSRAEKSPAPAAIIWNDIAMKGGLIYPPYILEKYFFPGLHVLVSILHSNGIKAVFHSDGDVSAVFDRLIECGIDGFNPLEISAGMEVSHFFEKYGRKVALVGGLDAVDVLAFGNPETVAEAAKNLIHTAQKSGGSLIIGSSSGQLDDSMPLENVTAYFNTVWETKNF
jgi:uroporphyrinogen-III decarboxylase